MHDSDALQTTKEQQLAQDYLFCQEVIKRHSKSFYYAFSKLPKNQAEAVYAVYAFCRDADDAVDEATTKEEQLHRLDRLEEELRLFEHGQEKSTPVWRALRDVFTRYPMDIEPFYSQLHGQRQDIEFVQPETLEELETYSYYVAGSVGLMLVPILASTPSEKIKQSGVSLGIAMQLTNILRDVGEDLTEINRVYLPHDLMEKHGYSHKSLVKKEITPSFINLWEEIAQRSEYLYDAFQKQIFMFEEDSRLPVLTSAKVYRGILDAVRKKKYDCFSREQTVSFLEKERLLREVKAYLRKS